jgi:hypothetical protein
MPQRRTVFDHHDGTAGFVERTSDGRWLAVELLGVALRKLPKIAGSFLRPPTRRRGA